MDATERRKRASSEAADWFSRLQAGEMERAERQQFVEWLRESHVHVTEMLRIAQIHGELKQFEHWARISTGPKAAKDNVVRLPKPPDEGSQDPHVHPPGSPPPRHRPKEGIRLFAAAAAIVLIVAAAVVVPKIRGHVIETERGERREVVLTDGSLLQIDPQTRLRVKYGDTVRRVFLERGRALFHVAKNPNRPFLVQADDTTVRAVGTAFGVEQRSHGVIVAVAEGKVSVSSPARVESEGAAERADAIDHSPSQGKGPGMRTKARDVESGAGPRSKGEGASSTPEISAASPNVKGQGMKVSEAGEVFLTANQQLMVQAGGTAEPVREVDSARALAWAEGQLIFQNDELGQVVAEFNRYNHVQLTVADPDLARRPVSGVFNAAEPEAFIAFLQTVTSVEIARDGDKTITISSARAR